ncbi:MAG: cellulase family glycosylhydrolase [Phycisphaerales bacterium]|nr:MAG: cellulase family glycosylhydrolase [Phycisphaerales bacterium]
MRQFVCKVNERNRRAINSILVLVLTVAGSASLAAAEWQMRVTEKSSVEVLCSQAPVVTAEYVFWGANWRWAGVEMRPGRSGTFSGGVRDMGLEIEGRVTSPAAGRLRYTWNITPAGRLDNIIGGGLEFRLVLDSPCLGGQAGEPVLLPDNRGWRWPVSAEGAVTVEFDKPLPNLYFERGNKGQIRAMFVGANVPEGAQTISMTVSLPAGGTVARTLAERYGPADTSKWYSAALTHDKSPVDLSFLNHKPAGKFGFVKAKGDKLVFENGEQVRFWGGNIAAYAIFVEPEQIRAQARRIAQLGYNLMRIHHHDSTRWVGRTVIDKKRGDSQHLDEQVMERLDYWIKCLRDKGVYVWLDLHVGRVFKEGDNIGEGFAEMAARGAEGKGYCYFNERIERLMKDFNAKYLNHVNRHTRLAYKDDPAIMGLLITNENDITSHFGNLMLADKNNPWHNRIFEEQVKAFAEKHGLEAGQTGRTWEPGPSKLFLADWEYRWNRRMLDGLSGLGVKVPVSTTQMWGGMSLYGLPPLTAGTIIDVHSYGRSEALGVNPRFKDNYVSYIASGQAYGMPVSISEWNVPWPNVDRFTAPLYVASISALQQWDAPMIYNYSQQDFSPPSRQGTWSTFSDLAITGIMPAAALLYRQAHVRPAEKSYCIMLDKQKLYMENSHPKNMASLRTLIEQSRVAIGLADAPELDWDRQTKAAGDVRVITDRDKDFIPPGQTFVCSDTGELTRDWVEGYQTIDTAMTQAVHGWVGGRSLRLKASRFDISTPKAAVAVSSLDGKPIGESRLMLITAVARVLPLPGNRMPLLSEPVAGRIYVAGPTGLELVPLAGDGTELPRVNVEFSGGRYVVTLPAPRGTHWFLLRAAAATAQAL